MTSPSNRVRLQIPVTNYQKLIVLANLAGIPVRAEANQLIGIGIYHALKRWATILGETPEEVWRKRSPYPTTEGQE